MRSTAAALLLMFGTAASAQDTNELLERAKTASVGSRAAIISAIGTAKYEHWHRIGNDKEPNLSAKAKVKVVYDKGKYHLTFDYETLRVKVGLIDAVGNESAPRYGEAKPEVCHILYDGTTAYEVSFGPRYRPAGCLVEVYDRWPVPSFSEIRDPAILHPLYVERVLENLDRETMKVTKLPSGAYRVNANHKKFMIKSEFDFHPDFGYNVVATKVFNIGQDKPSQETEATWKQSDGLWYVQKRVQKGHQMAPGVGIESRTAMEYERFEPNVAIAPQEFAIESLKIPERAQILDRRPKR